MEGGAGRGTMSTILVGTSMMKGTHQQGAFESGWHHDEDDGCGGKLWKAVEGPLVDAHAHNLVPANLQVRHPPLSFFTIT
jgi:hypothetical protein